MFSLLGLELAIVARFVKPFIPLGGVYTCLFVLLLILSGMGIYVLTEAFAEKLLPKIIVKEHINDAGYLLFKRPIEE